MKKILYLMEFDWQWIKQRPQFIAEGLSKYYEVTVIYKKRNRRKGLQNRNLPDLNLIGFISIPFAGRSKLLKKLNDCRYKSLIRKKCNDIHPEYIYLTDPEQSMLINIINKYNIIYDCMDDYAAFYDDKNIKREKKQKEEILVNAAVDVLCSSLDLRRKIISRYPMKSADRISLVRNGYSPFAGYKNEPSKKADRFIVSYFGSISKWFNFEYLLESTNEIDSIEYHLYGPVEDTEIPDNKKIIYKGVVEHTDILKAAEAADACIMPFIVNDIVESVDPVKLYEYIELNKNIICVQYEEIERFGDFVYFYSDYDSFIKQLKYVYNNREIKYSNERREEFLSNNTWEKRVDSIRTLIDGGVE